MGSLFGGKKQQPTPPPSGPPASAPKAPPPEPEVLRSPEVSILDKVPEGVLEGYQDHIKAGARGLQVDPEDEETRFFAFYEDRLVELGRCDVKRHEELLGNLNHLRNGAVGVYGVRYRIETFNSLSDFGDRMTLNFLEEGKYSDEEIVQRRRENIRLINKLKPATSLTRKNILDIHAVVSKNTRDKAYQEFLREEELVTPEQIEQFSAQADPLMALMNAVILPRKAAASALAHYLGIKYVDVEEASLDKATARRLDKAWCLKRQVVAFSRDDKGSTISVAMMDPTDTALIGELKEKLGAEIHPYCSAAQDIYKVIHKAHRVD